jgi:hypothetical protein
MKYLRRFNEDIEATIKNSIMSPNIDVKTNILDTIYDKRWENELSEFLTINYHNNLYKFKKSNIMLHSDMIQITYASTPLDSEESEEIWGSSDTLEFDIYFAKDDKDSNITLTIDITYGDAMVCEFNIEKPNKIKVIQYTSYGSKFDRSNTVFALTDDSLESFIKFLNRFDGMKLKREDFKFLDQYDNYNPKQFPKHAKDPNIVNKTKLGYPNKIN